MNALIVDDGRSLGALAAVRSLSRAGWRVGVGAPTDAGFAASSRQVSRFHRVPSVDKDLDAFLSGIRGAVEAGSYEIVFTGGDAELLAMSENRDLLGTRFPYAHHGVVSKALDKVILDRCARDSGLATPATVALGSHDWETGAVVVKARTHWTGGVEGAPSRLDASMCSTRAEADFRIAEITRHGGEAFVQELVSGTLMAYSVVCDRGGRVTAAVQQEVDRLDPSPPGSSTRARTVPVDDELAANVQGLMTRLDWFGVAELQFMRRGNEEPKMIDLNGRFYGSMSLAIAAGVDLPLMWARLVRGEKVPPVHGRAGVRYQWLHGDLIRAFEERRGGLARDLATTSAYAWGAVHPLWQRSDPWPALRYLFRGPTRAASRVRTR